MFRIVVFLGFILGCLAWQRISVFGRSLTHHQSTQQRRNGDLKMEYIPDGMSKAKWEALKKKEAEDQKKLKLGAIGITKFQSRSFEAWQKSGQKNLFPVDPNTPAYEKPYMQRKGGSADGSDLISKGVKATQLKGYAAPQAKTAVDAKYEQLEAKGLTRSSPFELPWSNQQAAKLATAKLSEEQKASQARKKAAAVTSSKAPIAAAASEAPKKKFFGLF